MITKKPNESRVESNIEPRAKGCLGRLLGLMNDDRLKARHGIELRSRTLSWTHEKKG